VVRRRAESEAPGQSKLILNINRHPTLVTLNRNPNLEGGKTVRDGSFPAAGAREAKCSHAFNEAGAKQLANDDDDSGKRLLSTISH